MVTALLRALGFDEEPDAPPGEGQDRAVGRGQDRRVGVGAASADVNQNTDLGLSRAEAAVACGPAAAVELARRYGDNIPVDAVIAAARQNGWRSPDGMSTGPQGFARTMRQLGYDVTVADLDASGQGPGWQQTRDALAGGQSVAIDTPGHYYQATDYDPARGYRLGDVVGAGNYYQPGAIGGIAGGRYGAPRNAIIASPGAGAQARGTGQPQLLSAQNGPQAPGQNGPPSVQQVAIQALRASDPQANNAEIADIMAAGALKESGANPNGPAGDGGASIGLWQLHSRGLGQGMSEAERRDPATAAARIAPEYQRAYAAGIRQGYNPATPQGQADLATYTYINAEHPADGPGTTRHATMTGPTAQQFRAHYAEVDAHSKQQQELQIGGGYAPPPGAPGQANAQAPSGPLQQAWAAAQTGIQQLLSQAPHAAMAAGEAVAGLGATPAHAAPEPQGPPPPPDAARDAANRQAAADRETALAAQRQAEASQAPAAAGAALSQPALQWGGGRNAPPPTPTAPAPAPASTPAAPTDYGPGGFAGAARAAAGPANPLVRPPGAPVTSLPGQPAPPATAPAAGIAETAPPAPGLPPDTATEHWDNNIRAWVPKTPATTFPGGGRYRIAPGVETATDERGNPAPNPPGTPVEYVPIQAGYYDTPQGRQYWDSTTQQWHQPTGQAATQGTPSQALAPGLSFVPSAPNSRSGTVFWEDPNTHAVTQAPYTLGDPMPAGLGQPQQAAQTPLQEAQTAQAQAQAAHAQGALNIPVEVGGRRYDPRTGADLGPTTQTPLQQAQTATANRALNVPVESGGVMYDQYGNALGAPAQTPLQEAQTAAANRNLAVPVEAGGTMYDQYGNALGPPAQSPLAQAQTQTAQANLHLPVTAGGHVQQPQFDDQGTFTGYQDAGLVPMTASEQSLLDERTREFGTLSAYQQSQAEQSKASLAQNESQFQQSLAEKQTESARPYSQMTKAEQAADARGQQELGLKKEQLGLSEAEAANKLENLPRGGHIRIDPFTGQSSLINAPEPEPVSGIEGMIYIPGGRNVSIGGHMVSGGPNPYAGVPTGGGGMFPYPGAQGGGMGGQQPSPYQNWGGQGGGGWGGQQGMSSSPGWQQPRQQQGWMGSGY